MTEHAHIAMPVPSSATAIGASVTRLEDGPLVSGAARFIADIDFPGQLHMRVVRSAYAHGCIRSIDVTTAIGMPGVVAVWTARDVAEIPPIGFRDERVEILAKYSQRILAEGTVRYVGEPVAVIFADDIYRAEDAEAGVLIEIDELPVVLDAAADPGEFGPGVSTAAMTVEKGYGDLEAAFATAHAVVALELEIGRHSASPMETRGAVARYDRATDMLELHGAAKVPHRNREQIARMLGRDKFNVHLFEYHVGGGFGVRGELYPEDVLVCAAAIRLGRPIKWIEDRREHLMAANHSRQQRHRISAAVDDHGVIMGLKDDFFHDQGAYVRTHGARVIDLTASMLPGPYRIPAYQVRGHFRLTNKTPAATYRAPGRYETTFVRERLMDAIAERLAIDRVEVRRRNLISASEMPFTRPMTALGEEVVFDSGDYAGLLDKALARFGWHASVAQAEARRGNGELVGIGLGMFVEKSGLGPTDAVRVSVLEDGGIELVTGGASLGQGFETVMAQICAETLGVHYRRVRVIHGQTNRIANGIGAHATRATVMTGSATQVAAQALKARILAAAAAALQAAEDSIEIRSDGSCVLDTGNGPAVSFTALRQLAGEDALTAEGRFDSDHMCYPYGVHIGAVCVDRETGMVKVERYLIAYDVGRAVNPMLIHGQLVGGFAQGLGGALFEEFLYDERGEPLSCTFADYLIPTAVEVPHVDVLITEDAPSPRNPLGLKGAGEGGINAVGAVLASAVDDALRIPGAINRLPMSPVRLRAALRAQERLT